MDFHTHKTVPNPREDANPISRTFFFWLFPLLRRGYRKNLEPEDLFTPLTDDSSKKLGDNLEKAWNNQVQLAKGKPSNTKLFKTLISLFGTRFLIALIALILTETVIRGAQLLCLKYLIESFSGGGDDEGEERQQQRHLYKYLYSGGLCLSTFLASIWLHSEVYTTHHIGMKCRIAVSSLIYRKALRLSMADDGNSASIGQFVNLLSNDVTRFDMCILFLPFLLVGPIQTILFTYFLWVEIGYSCFGGIAFILLVIPVQTRIGNLFSKYRLEISKRTDQRGSLMSEIITAINVIKMYAWEGPFSDVIEKVRQDEVRLLKKVAVTRGIYMSMFLSSSSIIAVLTFLVYVLNGHSLTASKVFFTMAVFGSIRTQMLNWFPVATTTAGEMWASMKRIEHSLLLDEQVSKDMSQVAAAGLVSGEAAGAAKQEAKVRMENVCASWSEPANKLTLDNVSCNLRGDSLVMIVGPVGSGKSSFLHTIVKELPIRSGQCQIVGSTSLATQEPWIFGGTLKQNVVFGLEYNEARYNEVIEASALKDDLKQLPFGDNTMVGERGAALSGGQKARLNLARALYRRADIYLLDDPLSAVDTRVSRHLFEKCVRRHLQGKLRILVTHQLQYLPQADYIIAFNEGRIIAQGTYSELAEQGVDFLHIMMADSGEEQRKGSAVSLGKQMAGITESELATIEDQERGKEAEGMGTGSIGLKLYWQYFKSGGSICMIFTIIFGFLLSQLLLSFTEIWLSRWTNDEELKVRNNVTEDCGQSDSDCTDAYLSQDTYIYVYVGATAALFIASTIRAQLFFRYAMKIGMNTHNRMFTSLMRTPVTFFDTNPAGRIMNRFTRDLGSLDDFLPPAFFDAATIYLLMFGIIIVVCISNYFLILPAAILTVFLAFVRRFYIATARSAKRIESVARSPLFTHLTTSVEGLTTIRASQAQSILVHQFDSLQDSHTSAWFVFISVNRWLAVWLELFSSLFLVAVTLTFILLSDNAMVGNVGLAISSLLAITGNCQWGVRQSAETENHMVSVERTLEYVNLQSEAPLESTPAKKPPSDWPDKGTISFRHVYLAYEEKDVLKDLTFDIKAKEKVGVVGRTGAGKSTVISALFRMKEPRDGQIFIDGLCINEIGLHDLRKNVSIIPQDPALFSGTVRYNLDPFDQFNDVDLWQVLKEVDLKDSVPSLDFKVSHGGANFSIGQRQLVCLARAILRRNKIIVMDEATANVDPKTDGVIQRTIREKFVDCTIVTIAHRLHSVIDCDRILVMDKGALKEFDHPHNLLQNPEGHFTGMVKHTGEGSANMLRKIAEESFNGKRRRSSICDGANLNAELVTNQEV